MRYGITALLLCLLVLGSAHATALPRRPRIFLVVVDGLDPRHAVPNRLPTLLGPTLADDRRVWRSLASMPSVTNTNHTTLVTGTEPDAHGVTGNAYWPRHGEADRAKLDDPALIETETIFTVAARTHPELQTLAILGKPKLGRLFSAAPGRQHAADVMWDPERDPTARHDERTGYASDDVVIDAVIARYGEPPPDLVVVNLPDVDRHSHGSGPDSADAVAAVRSADAAVGRLIADLRTRGWWDDAVIVVTADHGFDSVAPTRERPTPTIPINAVLTAGGVRDVVIAADGGVAHVYSTANDLGTPVTSLGVAAARARQVPGIQDVFARIPIAGVPPLPADWHLGHQRAGDLLLVAAPGYQLVRSNDSNERQLRGNHGSPRERSVPLIIVGGHPLVRALPNSGEVRHADIGASLFEWLGLDRPRQLDAQPAPAGSAGRPIDQVVVPPARAD